MSLRVELPRGGLESVSVTIRTVTAAEAPVALVIDDAEGRLVRPSVVALRWDGDHLWRKLGERYGYSPLSGAPALAEASADPERYDNPFADAADPGRRAAQLLIVDGEVWERVPEPVLRYQNGTDEGRSWVTVGWDRPEDPTEAYGLDQADVLVACHPGATGLELPWVKIIVPDCLRFDPVPAVVARAALEALETLAERDPGAGQDARLVALAKGGATQADVATILDVMAERGVTDGHPYALRHLLLRQQAMETPVPEGDEPSWGPGT